MCNHLDRDAVEDCRTIATMLAIACTNIYEVSWDAEEYAHDIPKSALPNPETEARLMAKYHPLISPAEMVRRHENNMPLIIKPVIVADIKGRTLLWSLPNILSPGRQRKILQTTQLLEAQLEVENVQRGAKLMTGWRTADTFYSKGSEWKHSSTLLSPAGFQLGHMGPTFNAAPSAAVRSGRALEWMIAFEESGGMLDGILAVTHPELYESSQALMEKIWRDHSTSCAIMATWPSCYTSLQVIINQSTLGHCDRNTLASWFDLLMTLGTYEKRAILELRGLSISLPYNVGSIVPLLSKLLLHGVPKRFEIPVVGMTLAMARGGLQGAGHVGTMHSEACGHRQHPVKRQPEPAIEVGAKTASGYTPDEGESEVSQGEEDEDDVDMADNVAGK